MTASIATSIAAHSAGEVATITVSNPAKLNVLDTTLMRALTAALREVGGNAALRAVVLAGEGTRAFIGGADINEMSALTPATGRALITTLHEVCAAVRACPVPVIARMRGYTLGAGLEIAAACDLRIATVGAKFGMPEVRIGIPSVIEAALLPQLIGWGRTRRLLLTGETIGAAKALDWGLVEEVVAEDALDGAIGLVLADILSCGPRAIRLQKRLMQKWEALTPDAAIQAGIDCFEESWRDPEPTRMMGEFLAARREGKR